MVRLLSSKKLNKKFPENYFLSFSIIRMHHQTLITPQNVGSKFKII